MNCASVWIFSLPMETGGLQRRLQIHPSLEWYIVFLHEGIFPGVQPNPFSVSYAVCGSELRSPVPGPMFGFYFYFGFVEELELIRQIFLAFSVLNPKTVCRRACSCCLSLWFSSDRRSTFCSSSLIYSSVLTTSATIPVSFV